MADNSFSCNGRWSFPKLDHSETSMKVKKVSQLIMIWRNHVAFALKAFDGNFKNISVGSVWNFWTSDESLCFRFDHVGRAIKTNKRKWMCSCRQYKSSNAWHWRHQFISISHGSYFSQVFYDFRNLRFVHHQRVLIRRISCWRNNNGTVLAGR